MAALWDGILAALTNGNYEAYGYFILPLLLATFINVWFLGGRFWAFLYLALIPFLNWSFGVISEFPLFCTAEMIVNPEACKGGPLAAQSQWFAQGVALHPMTIVTGLVFVIRDFVQRSMGHKVLVVMAFAIGWSFFYAWPVIALASGVAFLVSEMVDWAIFTFTKYSLSTRILISSAVAAPVDTTIFLYGADLAKQMELGLAPGNTLHWANWVVFIIGKMVGAVIISRYIRRRERGF